MEFAIYPFKRYGKYRLYVRFEDQYGNEVDRSTGISYGLKATKKEQKEAKKKAKLIIKEYLDNNEDSYFENEQNPRLSKYLKNDYWPHVTSSCANSTRSRYQESLDKYKRIDIERFKQQRLQEGLKKNKCKH